MTCRSHPRAYPAEDGDPSHGIALRCTALVQVVGTFIPGTEPWHLDRAVHYSRDPNGRRQARCLGAGRPGCLLLKSISAVHERGAPRERLHAGAEFRRDPIKMVATAGIEPV